jgi:hypothetical protein
MDQDWDEVIEIVIPAFIKEHIPILRIYHKAATDPE